MYKTFFCILQAKTLDLGCVEDPENAKEEEQLGVQSLREVIVSIFDGHCHDQIPQYDQCRESAWSTTSTGH